MSRKLIGEPFMRPDGKEVEIYEEAFDSGYIFVQLNLGGLAYAYGYEDTLAAGDGDHQLGYVRLGQAAYRATAESTANFAVRPSISPPQEQV
jgi:hypothetical protein